MEKAREEEQCRLQAEAEAERVRGNAEKRRVEQEQREREEEVVEARCRRSCLESTLTPVAAPETELPRSKGKGPELAPESEGVQELQRCDSCEKWDAECIRVKVSFLLVVKEKLADNLADRPVPLLSPLPGVEDLVLHRRWSSGLTEKGAE